MTSKEKKHLQYTTLIMKERKDKIKKEGN